MSAAENALRDLIHDDATKQRLRHMNKQIAPKLTEKRAALLPWKGCIVCGSPRCSPTSDASSIICRTCGAILPARLFE